jgi:hypothetical protein
MTKQWGKDWAELLARGANDPSGRLRRRSAKLGSPGCLYCHSSSGTSVHAGGINVPLTAGVVACDADRTKMTSIACSHISIRRIVFRTDGIIGRETSTAGLRWRSQGETQGRRPDAVRSGGKVIAASNLRLGARARMQRARVSRAAQARSRAPWKLGRAAWRNRNQYKSR